MTSDNRVTLLQLAASETSMEEPRPEVRALLNQWVEQDPRLKYPFMSKADFSKMQRERASREAGSVEA